MKCPLCDLETSETVAICSCGYNFKECEVTDSVRVRNFIKAVPTWQERVLRVEKVNRIQFAKHGSKGNHPGRANAPGWSQNDTARLLGIHPSTMTRHMRQAEGLATCPQLQRCSTMKAAHQAIGLREKGIQEDVFGSEEELRGFIEQNWDEIKELSSEWEIAVRWRDLDLLAKHKTDGRCLVIELKLDREADKVVGQILRYMGEVRIHRSGGSAVEGLIICRTADEGLVYALACMEKISLREYSLCAGKLSLTAVSIPHTAAEWKCRNFRRAIKRCSAEELEALTKVLEKRKLELNQ